MIDRHDSIACCLTACFCLCTTAVSAQQRGTPNPATIRQLDMEANRLQQGFVEELTKLADGYEEAGDLNKAKATLRRVLQLDPSQTEVEQRLEEMRNRVFDSNEVELEVDVARGWTPTGLTVEKDKPFRISAEGSYKLLLNATLSAEGIADEDINRDMTSGIRLGALMGVVFPPPPKNKRTKPKPGPPFALGGATEFTPGQSGMLFLRLNVPAGTKSIGKVKVTISGNFDR
jgi:hypothetical protein